MVRTKHIAPIARPQTSPLLQFEIFNPDGNKEDSVVYFDETGLLKYNGKNYMLGCKLPEGCEITEVFLVEKFRGEDTMFLCFEDEDENEVQIKCKLTVLPGDAEKVKLTTVFKDFRAEMAEETKGMADGFKRMKNLMTAFNASVESVCAGFNFHRDLDIDLPKPDSMQFRNMDGALEFMSREIGKLSEIEPFSKKRKSCD
jgi:hypothetical protein